MDTKTVYIYGLVDPRTNEVRYVGKTINPTNRHNQHLKFRAYYAHTYKARWINSLKQEKLQPKFVILEKVNNDRAVVREQYWIGYYKNLVGDGLTNSTTGGQGPRNPIIGRKLSEETKRKIGLAGIGRPCSNETRKRMSESQRKRPPRVPITDEQKDHYRQARLRVIASGFTISKKARNKISKRFLGKSLSIEHKKKIGIANKGNILTLETRRKIAERHKKPILQFDLLGNFIKEFDSIKQAQEETHIEHICRSCKGKQAHAGHFKWQYKNFKEKK